MELKDKIKNEINIKKGFINNLEDFEKITFGIYGKHLNEFENIELLSIVKNYLNTVEFSIIILKNIKIFSTLKYLNL